MSDVEVEVRSATPTAEEIVDVAVACVRDRDTELRTRLEALDAPIYLTDEQGWITFFNRACVDFAGRTPVTGQDRWCVTWRLYTEGGSRLAHEDCPMAVAIKQRKTIRGVIAVAERPDGTRVLFTPYPTPVHDEDGRLIGAVNLLIDVTDERQAAALRVQARRCRRLAQSVTDRRTVDTLTQMAAEYEEKARALGAS